MREEKLIFFRVYGAIIFTLLIYGILFYVVKSLEDKDSSNACKNNFEELISYEADGIVVEKYIQTKNHNFEMIIVKNYKGGWTRFMVSLDQSGLYDSLEIGYLLKKNPDDPKVFFGKDSLNKTLTIDFGCQ